MQKQPNTASLTRCLFSAYDLALSFHSYIRLCRLLRQFQRLTWSQFGVVNSTTAGATLNRYHFYAYRRIGLCQAEAMTTTRLEETLSISLVLRVFFVCMLIDLPCLLRAAASVAPSWTCLWHLWRFQLARLKIHVAMKGTTEATTGPALTIRVCELR